MDTDDEEEPLDDYIAANVKLNEEANELLSDLLPIIDENSKYEDEILRSKHEMINKMSDHAQNVTMDDLLYTMNVKTKEDVESFRRKKEESDVQLLNAIIDHSNKEYLRQPWSNEVDWYETEIKELNAERLRIDLYGAYIGKFAAKIDRARNVCDRKFKQLESLKLSLVKFLSEVGDQLKDFKEEAKSEKAKLKRLYDELEEVTYGYEIAENDVLHLLMSIAIPEGCYMVTTWLSPAEWREGRGIDELNYDFARSDSDLIKPEPADYKRHAYQKPLADFRRDLQKYPVLEMYWTSPEQFDKKLSRLHKQTLNALSVSGIIAESDKGGAGPKKSTYQAKSNLKKQLLTKKTEIKEIVTQEYAQEDFEHVHGVYADQTMINIKTIAVRIYAELGHPYADYNQTKRAVKYLFSACDEQMEKIKLFPEQLWKKTGIVMQVRKSVAERKRRWAAMRCLVFRTVQREADRMYELMPSVNVRVQKPVHFRSAVHKRRRSEIPAKPELTGEQLAYLKYLTYLSPEDVTDVGIVPELADYVGLPEEVTTEMHVMKNRDGMKQRKTQRTKGRRRTDTNTGR